MSSIQLLQDKYPNIIDIIPAMETAKNPEKILGFYTLKIEQKKDKNSLEQWIEYLANKSGIQAVLAINKLKKVSKEEKDELTKILLKVIQKEPENIDKYEKLMLTLLQLKDFKKAKILYGYVKYILSNEVKKIEKEREIQKINNYLSNYLENRIKYIKIFLDEEENVSEEETLGNYLFSNKDEKLKRCNEILENLFDYLKSQESKLQKVNISVLPIKLDYYENSQLSKTINKIDIINKKLSKKCDNSLLDITRRVRTDKAKLIEIFNEENIKIQKIIEESIEVIPKDKRLELIYEFDKINTKISEILKDYDYLETNEMQQIHQYEKNVEKIYNIIFNYKQIKTKILKMLFKNYDEGLKVFSDIMAEEEIRRN